MLQKFGDRQKYFTLAVMILSVLGLSGGVYLGYKASGEIVRNTAELEGKILELGDKNIALAEVLKKEQERNGEFQTQIEQITGTVGTLDKLAKTDKELLQKYSKVYFLNENYVPKKLVEVPKEYLFDRNKQIRIHASTSPFLLQMMDDAKKDGADLLIISGFRSFGDQSSLKSSYNLVYGSGANQFSADQGYSEHQLGTTVDFTTPELGVGFTGFKNTTGYEWLLKNAYKYGFALSYPEENSYYQFEPWHFRFVGRKLTERLHEEKQNFYDLSQRTLDNYLINIFD